MVDSSCLIAVLQHVRTCWAKPYIVWIVQNCFASYTRSAGRYFLAAFYAFPAAAQGVAEAESRRAADDAERAYAASFDEAGVPAEEAALEAEHQHALVAAQRVFDEAAVGDESVRHANEERFRQACERRQVEA